MSLLLTAVEVFELTGRKQPAAQVRWLARRGWKYELDFDGRPKVARAYFECRLVRKAATTEQQHSEFAVNVKTLRCAHRIA